MPQFTLFRLAQLCAVILGVPIVLDEKVIGVLEVENEKNIESKNSKAQFTESDQTLLETLAVLVANTVSLEPALVKSRGPYVFVLMPFAKEFLDIYEFGIKACTLKLGCRCERVDEIDFNDRILDEIYSGIQRADIIVAEMTGRNPNVFYEVGYAHALSKEVILLAQDANDIPFDLKGHNFIVYDTSIKHLTTNLEKRLSKLIDKFNC